MKLHPNDVLNLFDLRSDLKIRYMWLKAMGTPVKDMLTESGRSKGYITKTLDNGNPPWDWRWTTVESIADSLGGVIAVDITGVDLVVSPMHQIGLEKAAFLGVGVMESLDLTRIGLGITPGKLAEAMGITGKSIAKLVQSNAPALSTMYRYSRAIGGRCELRFEEKK